MLNIIIKQHININLLYFNVKVQRDILGGSISKRKFATKGGFSLGISKVVWKKSSQFFNFVYNKIVDAAGFVFHKNTKLFEYCIDCVNTILMVKISNAIKQFLLKVDFRTLIQAVVSYSRYEIHSLYFQILFYSLATTVAAMYWSGAIVEPSVYHLNVVHESINAVGTTKTNFVYSSDQLKISIDYLVNFSQNIDIQNTVKKMTTLVDSKLSPSEIQVKIQPLINDFNVEYESAIEKDNWYHRLLFKLCFFLLLFFVLSQLSQVPNEAFVEEIISPESEVSSWETVSNSSQESDQ